MFKIDLNSLPAFIKICCEGFTKFGLGSMNKENFSSVNQSLNT